MFDPKKQLEFLEEKLNHTRKKKEKTNKYKLDTIKRPQKRLEDFILENQKTLASLTSYNILDEETYTKVEDLVLKTEAFIVLHKQKTKDLGRYTRSDFEISERIKVLEGNIQEIKNKYSIDSKESTLELLQTLEEVGENDKITEQSIRNEFFSLKKEQEQLKVYKELLQMNSKPLFPFNEDSLKKGYKALDALKAEMKEENKNDDDS